MSIAATAMEHQDWVGDGCLTQANHPPGNPGRFTPEERTALGDALPAIGETTFDVYLNARTFWRNVPAAV